VSVVLLFGTMECPVCADSGSLICLKRKQAGAFVFYCPLCGIAFREVPPPGTVDEILSLQQIAPDGVELPSRQEVEASGLELEEVSDHWLEWLTTRDPRTPSVPPVLGG
jgi:hypothetical protein